MSQTEVLYSFGGAATNLATFTAEDNLLKTYPLVEIPGSFFGMPANVGQRSTTMRVRAGGQVGSTGSPTFTFTLRVGTSGTYASSATPLLGTSTAMIATATVTLGTWILDMDITLRTAAVSGATTCTVVSMGSVGGNGFTLPGSIPVAGTSPAVTTWDTAASYYMWLGASCGTSNSLNLINCQYFKVYGDN